jgi:DNA-binding PadR family transcriptional regulator
MLVKQAFLAETIRPLYHIWLQTFPFVRYFHGPYSQDIFTRLDTLIFNGLVQVTAVEHRGARTKAQYRVTPAGHHLVERFGDQDIVHLATDLIWALQSLGIEQAGTICKLVYQEAEFARIFAQHNQQGIGPETKVPLPIVTSADNETFRSLAILQELQYLPGARRADAPKLLSREVVRLFLQSLVLQLRRTERPQDAAA